MPPCPAALAVPGDIATLTGGYLYDRHLLATLRAGGRDVALLELADAFPDPAPGDVADATARLAEVEPNRPVIVDGLALGAMPAPALAGMRAPLIALIHHPLAHEGGMDPARRDFLIRSERDALARAAAVIVTSRHTADLLASDYGVPPSRLTVARPGVARPTTPRRPVDPPLILSVGIRAPRKGHDVFLRALALIAARRWQAVIVGGIHDAGHAGMLETLRSELGLGDRVRFAERLPRKELETLYSIATVFALATRYEGHGIVFDEAMAHGLPVVTTRVGAVPQTLAPGAGLLVQPDDPSALAEALDRVLSETDLCAGMEAASARAGAELPSWADTAATVGTVIDRVAAEAMR